MKNDYYVYTHIGFDNTVFYVGMGRERRAYGKNSRSKAWAEAARDGYRVVLIRNNLTKEDAQNVELSLINNPPSNWKLVNTRKTNVTKPVPCTKEFLEQYVYYDETSPTCLRWAIDRYVGEYRKTLLYKRGDVAGYVAAKNRYYHVGIMEKYHCVHRVIYALLHGETPDHLIVNHIDNNGLNNRAENLELCTRAENNRRTKAHRGGLRQTNSSGYNGVHLLRTRGGHNYYVASWTNNGKDGNKLFPIHKLGETEAFRLACEHRKQMIEKLNSEGAGYSIAE